MSRTQLALVIGLAALMLPGAAANEVYAYFNPLGDKSPYLNVSLDIADIQKFALAGDYAQANSVYSNGKNSARNFTAGIFRIPKNIAIAGRNHSGEAYWEAFRAYYGTDTFVDTWLGGALSGTGEFATSDAFRSNSAAVYASVYGWIYVLHEVDLGYLYMTGYTSAARNVTRNATRAISEVDDGYAMYLGKGLSSPRATALAAAKKACLSSSLVNAQMMGAFEGFTKAQAAAIAFFKAGDSSEGSALYAPQYLAGRTQMVHFVVRSWVQMTMENLRQAVRTINPARRDGFKARALAAFRAAAPFINAQPGGTCTVEACFRHINTISRASFKKVKAALNAYYVEQDVDFNNNIYDCDP